MDVCYVTIVWLVFSSVYLSDVITEGQVAFLFVWSNHDRWATDL